MGAPGEKKNRELSSGLGSVVQSLFILLPSLNFHGPVAPNLVLKGVCHACNSCSLKVICETEGWASDRLTSVVGSYFPQEVANQP